MARIPLPSPHRPGPPTALQGASALAPGIPSLSQRVAHVHRPHDRPRPLRQARADPPGSERADREWPHHLRTAHHRFAADAQARAGAGRGGDGHLAPGAPEGRRVERGRFAGAGRRTPVRAARPRSAAGARLGRRCRRAAGPAGAAGKLPHERGRGQG
ncbi:hypothetical protein G6F35_015839 [Rhizopus arrhizus]|nr:hypothetical protein G6F35_015839 [Rhizopus arrhizus]